MVADADEGGVESPCPVSDREGEVWISAVLQAETDNVNIIANIMSAFFMRMILSFSADPRTHRVMEKRRIISSRSHNSTLLALAKRMALGVKYELVTTIALSAP